MRALLGFGVAIETPAHDLVASVNASGGISLGESYAVALADEHDGTLLVGRDPEFDDLPADIAIERIGAADS